MSCPICGAKCRCKNRGPEGLCCSCHRHKVRRILVTRDSLLDESSRKAFDQHVQWFKDTQPQAAHVLEENKNV